LSILFQIDFEVIRTMRRESFSFSFAENIGKFMIFRRNVGQIRIFCKFCRVSLNVQKKKIEFEIVGAQEFDTCKKATAPIIVMLGCSELDTEVSDVGMETVESDDCRGISKQDGDANSVLAVVQEGTRFSCKDRQKFIDPFTQSISGLYQVSQLYPRTKEQVESSEVT